MKLQGKTVLVTGASAGIGKAIALRAGQDGATVIIASRNLDKMNSVKSEVEKAGGKCKVYQTDVSKVDDVRNLFLAATKDGRVLDVVVANAGIGFIGEIEELAVEQIKNMINVNLTGTIITAKFASEIMVRQRYGHIFMTSSMAGLITLPQWSVYCATKWGITGFADSIRHEMKNYGVQVTTIHPGAVKTEFFDKDKADIDISKMGDAIEPSEVADRFYDAVFTDQKKVLVPDLVRNFSLMYKFAPGMTDKMIEKMAKDVEYHSDEIPEDEPEFSYVKSVR